MGRSLGRVYNNLDNWQVFAFLQMELYYLGWQFLPLAVYQGDMIHYKAILQNKKKNFFGERYCFATKQYCVFVQKHEKKAIF